MAYSGQPLREPVAMGGPFVMNSQAEIEQAFRELPLRQVRRHPLPGPPPVPMSPAACSHKPMLGRVFNHPMRTLETPISARDRHLSTDEVRVLGRFQEPATQHRRGSPCGWWPATIAFVATVAVLKRSSSPVRANRCTTRSWWWDSYIARRMRAMSRTRRCVPVTFMVAVDSATLVPPRRYHRGRPW